MRISFFTQWFPPEPANVVGSLATELAKRGHELDVVTGFPNYPTGRIYPGHRIRVRDIDETGLHRTIRVPLVPSHNRSAAGRVANYLSFALAASTLGLASVRKPDVAYVYHPPITSAWPARIQRAMRNVPYVLHVQDLWPDSVVHSGMLGSVQRQRFIERALSRACLSTYCSAAHIVVISQGFKRILINRGVPADKVTIVHNWADESVFEVRAPNPEDRSQLGPSDARLVLYAGNLGDYQGLDEAILGAESFKRRVHLTLIGDGIARARLEQLIQDRHIENVTILPQRAMTDMPRLLTAADVHLVSLADLNFLAATIPGKTQVAMASAKPLIMGARGDAASLVIEAGAGFACSPTSDGYREAFEAIMRVDDCELQAMGLSGRRYYENHLALRRAGDAFDEVFRDVAHAK